MLNPTEQITNLNSKKNFFRIKMKIISLYIVSIITLLLSISEAATLNVGAGKEFSTIQAAVDSSGYGDIIEIYAGTYTGSGSSVVHIDNKSNRTIRAAEPGVFIDGEHARTVICVFNSDYVTIDGNGHGLTILNGINLDLGHNYPYRWGGGYINYSGDFWVIKDVNFAGQSGSTKYPYRNPESTYDQYDGVGDIRINFASNGTLENVIATSSDANYNLFLVGKYSTVKNSTFKNGLWYPVQMVGADGSVFEKNYVYTSRIKDSASLGFGAKLRESTGVTIRYNVFDASESNMLDVLDIYDDNDNSYENHMIYNNIFIAGPKQEYAIGLVRSINDTSFMNNIVYNPDKTAVLFLLGAGSSNITFSNNNLYSSKMIDNGNNSNYTSINNINAYPAFKATGNKPSPYWHYSSKSSPGVDIGLSIYSYSGTDMDGYNISQGNGIDIGAFEFTTNDGQVANAPPNPPLLLTIE